MLPAGDTGQRRFDVGRVFSKNQSSGEKKVEVTLEIYIAAHQPPLRVGMSHHLDVMGTFVQSAIQDFCRHTSVHAQLLSHVRFFVTPWAVGRQVPLSTGFSRQEYWSGLPFPPPGDLPDPGTVPASPVAPSLAGGFFTTSATWKAP